jgi:hypothetical protein
LVARVVGTNKDDIGYHCDLAVNGSLIHCGDSWNFPPPLYY